MIRYLLKRLGQAVLTVFGLSLIVFFMIRLTGDPVRIMVSRQATEAQVAALRHDLGFDRPILVQYWDFVRGMVEGNFGVSLHYRQPALQVLLGRLPATMELATGGLLVSLILAVPVGVLAAARPGSLWDGLTQGLALLCQSIPTYWAGLVLILFFAVQMHWVPSFGRGGWTSYILPVVTISLQWIGPLARLTRTAMLEILQEDYVLTARAKGCGPFAIYFQHALRNAAIPLLTYAGVAFGYMLGGSVLVESVFAWPGLGYLGAQAIYVRDFPLVQAVAVFVSVMFLTVNLLVDLLYAVMNPRVRYA